MPANNYSNCHGRKVDYTATRPTEIACTIDIIVSGFSGILPADTAQQPGPSYIETVDYLRGLFTVQRNST